MQTQPTLFLWLLALVISCFLPQTMQAQTMQAQAIQWHTDYDGAVKLSQDSSKPMLLFFTGSGWCSWCDKLEKEVFDTTEFAAAASDRFIFVKIDFPRKKTAAQNLSTTNFELKQRYNIQGFPTIVLLDSRQQKLGQTGYRPGGGKSYYEHLLTFLSK